MPGDTWLKLHTGLLTSQRYINLPSNDHRVAFISMLLLAKKGLENAPESYILGHVFVGKSRWKTVREDLIESGLLDAHGRVNGFEESQLTPDAYRKRRQRERDAQRDMSQKMSRDKLLDSRMQSAESREEEEEDKREATLPCPAAPVTVTPPVTRPAIPYEQIIGHLNDKAGTRFSPKTEATRRFIKARFAEGRTVEDFIRVIDDRCAAWRSDEKMRQFLRPETLFNASKFESYLGGLPAGTIPGESWEERKQREIDARKGAAQ